MESANVETMSKYARKKLLRENETKEEKAKRFGLPEVSLSVDEKRKNRYNENVKHLELLKKKNNEIYSQIKYLEKWLKKHEEWKNN